MTVSLTNKFAASVIELAAENIRQRPNKSAITKMFVDFFYSSNDLTRDLQKLKSNTEFARFAIRISEIVSYLNSSEISFLAINSYFRDSALKLAPVLSEIIDRIEAERLRTILNAIKDKVETREYKPTEQEDDYPVNDSQSLSKIAFLNKFPAILSEPNEEETNIIREIAIIVKATNEFLDTLRPGDSADYKKYSELMRRCSFLTTIIGFDISSRKAILLRKGLEKCSSGEIKITDEIIRQMKSCLIIIIALSRGKKIDLDQYFNRAKELQVIIEKSIGEK